MPLWFLVSLLVSLSLLALGRSLSIQPLILLIVGFLAYAVSLMASAYSETAVGLGHSWPLEQRGPLIAFLFLALGNFFAVSGTPKLSGATVLGAGVVAVFTETALLSHFAGVPFHERAYLLGTILLAAGAMLFALQHPNFGGDSIVSKVGKRSLGIYVVHTPLLLGAVGMTRQVSGSPVWELLFPFLVLTLSYLIAVLLGRIPYVRVCVL